LNHNGLLSETDYAIDTKWRLGGDSKTEVYCRIALARKALRFESNEYIDIGYLPRDYVFCFIWKRLNRRKQKKHGVNFLQ
jgi:hypothetical protein